MRNLRRSTFHAVGTARFGIVLFMLLSIAAFNFYMFITNPISMPANGVLKMNAVLQVTQDVVVAGNSVLQTINNANTSFNELVTINTRLDSNDVKILQLADNVTTLTTVNIPTLQTQIDTIATKQSDAFERVEYIWTALSGFNVTLTPDSNLTTVVIDYIVHLQKMITAVELDVTQLNQTVVTLSNDLPTLITTQLGTVYTNIQYLQSNLSALQTTMTQQVLASNVFASPTITREIYVNQNGNDATGTGSFGAPYKTILHAVQSITSSTNSTLDILVRIGPGTYVESATILYPGFMLEGAGIGVTMISIADGGTSASTLSIPSTIFANGNYKSAMRDLSIVNSTVVQLDLQILGGNSTAYGVTIQLERVEMASNVVFKGRSIRDTLLVRECTIGGSVNLNGGQPYIIGGVITGALNVTDIGIYFPNPLQYGMVLDLNGVKMISGVTFLKTTGQLWVANLKGCGRYPSLVTTITGTGSITINLDEASRPVSRTLNVNTVWNQIGQCLAINSIMGPAGSGLTISDPCIKTTSAIVCQMTTASVGFTQQLSLVAGTAVIRSSAGSTDAGVGISCTVSNNS